MKHFRKFIIALAVALVASAIVITVSVDAKRRRPKTRFLPAGPPVAVVTVDDSLETLQPVVTLTTGYFTAVTLPSPAKQLVSRLIDTGAISEKKGKEDSGNTIYLTAEKAGKKSNVVIETGYGVINFNVVTTSGEDFTRLVRVRQSKYEDEVRQLKRQLASADERVSSLTGQLEVAQSQLAEAKVAALTAFRQGRAAGSEEQRKVSVQDLLTASSTWKLKKKQRQGLQDWIAAYLDRSKQQEGVPTNVTAATRQQERPAGN